MTKKSRLSIAFISGAFILGCGIYAAAKDGPPPNGEQQTQSSEGHARKGRRGPPPEAFTACENKAQNDVCNVETPHGSLKGTCGSPRQETRLVCIPDDHKKHGGPPPRPSDQK